MRSVFLTGGYRYGLPRREGIISKVPILFANGILCTSVDHINNDRSVGNYIGKMDNVVMASEKMDVHLLWVFRM